MLVPATPLFAYSEEGPPISITSPDNGHTFAYASVKSHILYWNRKGQVLMARVVFTDALQNFGQPNEDTQEFRIPGVTYDPAKGLFWAVTKRGIAIPVARTKKVLFANTIEVLPNANVRIQRDRGLVTLILEAIPPDDPAMHPAPVDPNGSHKLDENKIFN